MMIATGGLVGAVLLLFFLLVRGQRDTIVLQVQPVSDPMTVQVYVGGEVNNPGLYALPRGSRVADAVTSAGGLLSTADTSAIGMAAVLEDADQIIVPARRPTPQPAIQPPVVATTPALTQESTPTTPVPEVPSTETSALININIATAAEMDWLPGIGPVLASRIVEYRLTHGPFQTLEELEQVSGISARMVEELRPLITLGP